MTHDDPADQPAHYQRTTERQLAARRSHGTRRMGFGAVWLVAGLLITIITLSQFATSGFAVVAVGPIIGGAWQMVSGYRMAQASTRRPPA